MTAEPRQPRARPNRLAEPALAPLVAELHRRLGEDRPPAAVVLRDLDDDSRRALADLLGADRLPRPDRYRVPVDRLLRALGLPDVDALRSAVEQRAGPIVDRSALRQAAANSRATFWAWFDGEVAGVADALTAGGSALPPPAPPHDTRHALERWADGVRAQGIVGGVERHRARLGTALAVLRAVATADGVPLPVLAAEAAGDPHALDQGRAVARLVLGALAAVNGIAPPADAEAARLLWERAGVVPDTSSSTVLVLGLRPAGRDPLSGWLRACTDHGEPAVVSLAHLRRWPVSPLEPGRAVYVVENPSILSHAAGNRRGGDGPVIVCSSGRPTVAVVALLRQLRSAGAVVRQHADFDRSGIDITTWLRVKTGTVPWCMTAGHYRAALTVDRAATRRALDGTLPPTPWDPALRAAMVDAGVAVYEEDVRDTLLAAMA